MIKRLILVVIFVVSSAVSGYAVEKTYKKIYAHNGRLEAEGWVKGSLKTGYWKFYHENGAVARKGAFKENNRDGYWFFFRDNKDIVREGHFKKGIMVGWWIFNNYLMGQTEKCQYSKDQKQGYCFYYRGEKLFRAEKYASGEKRDEWTNLAGFIADNPNPSF